MIMICGKLLNLSLFGSMKMSELETFITLVLVWILVFYFAFRAVF